MLPNLIIIGAQKCATTSLHYYLGLHPQIIMSRNKELDFFVLERNWSKGLAWYESHFTGKAKVYGESSPNYTIHQVFGGVAERMHGVVPEARLIYVVRDPLERMVSHYLHEYTRGAEQRSITDALEDSASRYFYRSMYYPQLEQYLRYFPKENILILAQEDLFSARQRTLGKAFRFLEVDPAFRCAGFADLRHESRVKRRKNQTGLLLERVLGNADRGTIGRLPPKVRGYAERAVYLPFSSKVKRPCLSEELHDKLAVKFRDDVNRLRAHTGDSFGSWSV